MRVFSVGLLLVAVVFVAGCGGGTSAGRPSGEAAKRPAEVVRDAVKALEGATAFHLSGHVSSGEQEIGIDMSIVRGKGAAWWICRELQASDVVVRERRAAESEARLAWTRGQESPRDPSALES